MSLFDKKYYYFIGAGGIGMSALERYFYFLGKNVLGYDKVPTELTDELNEEGIQIHFEDNPDLIPHDLIPENSLIIYTPAVPKDLKELNHFLDNGYEVIKRSEVLGRITAHSYGIAVAGTHGKTTTSSIIGHILKVADLKSTAFLGGITENYDSNIIINGNEYTVAEADEFDRSFLRLSPKIAVITSVDADHLDIYGDAKEFEKGFHEFAAKVSDQLFVKKGLPFPEALTYGIEDGSDYETTNVRIVDGHYIFDVKTPKTVIKDVSIQLPGRHNVENATAAIAIASYLNISDEVIHQALASFQGVKRRFNRFFGGGKVYIDDYAHHPTELEAVFASVRELYPNKKVLAVFQPHLFTRTRDFADGFAKSLGMVDKLILLDIYPARELPIDGITSEWLANKIDLPNKVVCSLSEGIHEINKQDFDVLITVGAGNIDLLIKPIKEMLNEIGSK